MASTHARGIERIASELGVDVADVAPPRMARVHTDRSSTVREIRRIAGMSTATRASARIVDESTCRHEAGHAVAAHGLGWHVVYVDAFAGETKIEAPEYWEQSLAARHRQHNAIAAAGSVAAGTSSMRDENLSDRVKVRMLGRGDFEDARKLAARLLADRWAKPALERLTAALVARGRLEGAELERVLEGE